MPSWNGRGYLGEALPRRYTTKKCVAPNFSRNSWAALLPMLPWYLTDGKNSSIDHRLIAMISALAIEMTLALRRKEKLLIQNSFERIHLTY